MFRIWAFCLLVAAIGASGAAAAGVMNLVNGVAVTGDVVSSDYNYYTYEIGDVEYNQPLKIEVPMSNGAGYVYAKFGSLPNSTSFTWYDSGRNNPTLSIRLNPTTPSFQKGTLYISVLGTQRSFYTITAISGDLAASPLNGAPVAGTVAQKSVTYFSFQMNPGFRTQKMQISLTNVVGDPDLYVATASKTKRPSTSLYQWKSTAGVGSNENIVILPNDPSYDGSEMYIAVVGLQATNTFTLTVTVGEAVALFNGVPKDDTSFKGSCQYYTYDITPDRWNQTLTIIANFNFGTAGLYASFEVSRPDSFHYFWSDNSGDYRKIQITPEKLKQATLFVSMCANNVDRAVYTLRPISGTDSPICFGQPSTAVVSLNRPSYATVALDQFTNLADLVVTVRGQNEARPATFASFKNFRPAANQYDWNGMGGLVIPASQLSLASLYIGIWSNDASATTYNVQVSQKVTPIQLANGTSTAGKLLDGQIAYYSIKLGPFQKMSTVVTFRVGKAALIISNQNTFPWPSCSFPRWSDDSGDYRRVDINPSMPGFAAGTFNILVKANSNVAFDIISTIFDV